MLGKQIRMTLYIHFNSLLQLLDLLVVLLHVLAVNQRTQQTISWVGILQRRGLLQH